MSSAAIIHFKPSNVRTEEDRVQKFLHEFSVSGSFQAADQFRKIALPESDFAGSLCLPDGRWIAELRYDHLLHEGEGLTEAAALVDAVLSILAATKT